MSTPVTAAATRGPSAPSRAFQTRPADHRFFSILSIVTAVTILAGFSSTYLPKVVAGAPPLPLISHLPTPVFTSRLVLYLTPTPLLLPAPTAAHRRPCVAAVLLPRAILLLAE